MTSRSLQEDYIDTVEVLTLAGLVVVPCLPWNARARRPGKAPLSDADGHRVECATVDAFRPWLRRVRTMNIAALGVAQVDADNDAAHGLARDLGVTSSASVWMIRTARGYRNLYRLPKRRLRAVTKNGDPKAEPLVELDLLVDVPAIVPPSRHPSGTWYRWVPGRSPFEISLSELVEPPPLLLDHWENLNQRGRAGGIRPGPPALEQPVGFDSAMLTWLGTRTNGRPLREKPNGWIEGITCPFPELHAGGDEHPSFSINLRLGVWKCWSHGESGSLRSLAETFNIVAPRRYRGRHGSREVRMPVTREDPS